MHSKVEYFEILPGYKIEVTEAYRKRAKLTRAQKLLIVSDAERRELLATIGKRRTTRKYSRQMLDEAAELAAQIGVRRAAKRTGINAHSIERHIKNTRAKKRGPLKKDGDRYTNAQKQACVECAHDLVRKGKARGFRPAFIECGRRLGINGRSIEYQWSVGLI